ncbi:hypothetical protein B0H16DRAFT_1447898 [Mycena metata]|uniref:Uncharacterized protein n=1 Tax=Mycena metata TaxID=1033252 RepID=A0AAD7KAD7_9AGAR|nr:hypothetical protein B0H16DRAFT_1447898 [Mycena metata]
MASFNLRTHVNGRDFAGVVVTPPRKPSRIRRGDVIFGPSTGYRDVRKAAYQEYVVSTDYDVARVPATLQVNVAATIGVALIGPCWYLTTNDNSVSKLVDSRFLYPPACQAGGPARYFVADVAKNAKWLINSGADMLRTPCCLDPGMNPAAVASKSLASTTMPTDALCVNIVSGWFKTEFTSIGQWWLDHAERFRRSRAAIHYIYSLKPKPLNRPGRPHPENFQGGNSIDTRENAGAVRSSRFRARPTWTRVKVSANRLRTTRDKTGMWANSKLEDFVQYNGDFKIKLIGTKSSPAVEILLMAFLHYEEEIQQFRDKVIPLVRQFGEKREG